jgi:hypothetical protein
MMQITKDLVESLLHEEESAALDFKRDQYPFAGASPEEKSEILKDVIAFANAFRRTDAFILIGVEDVKGGRGKVVGVEKHIDDADLQQFINSKTQRTVTFSYKAAEHDGLPIGVIHIPLQERPVFAKVKYGKVDKEVAYIRRGSSTAPANPDEIAQMGAERAAASAAATPSLELMLIDRGTGKSLGTETSFQTLLLDVPDEKDIPDYHSARQRGFMAPSIYGDNRDYYRELAAFTKAVNYVRPVAIAVKNTGETSAQDVRLVFEIDDPSFAYEFIEEWDMPEPPRPQRGLIRTPHIHTVHDTHDVSVARIGDTWRVEGRCGKIQPQEVAQLENLLFAGARNSGTLSINAQLFADNLPRPQQVAFALAFEVTRKQAALDDVETMERERFFNTPEGSKLLDELRQDEEED